MIHLSIWMLLLILLNGPCITQASVSIVYRTSLQSSSIRRMSISTDANTIALADSRTSEITILQKNTHTNLYTSRTLLGTSFKSKYGSYYHKIHLNEQGTYLYYINNNNNFLVMVDIRQQNLVETNIHQCIENQCYYSWAGVNDNIVVISDFTVSNRAKIYLYNCTVKVKQHLESVFYSSFPEIKLYKDPYTIIMPSVNIVIVYNIDSSFSNVQSSVIFNWTSITAQYFYKKSFYFYNIYSSQIWRISCLDSLSRTTSQQTCPYSRQNLVRTKPNFVLQPSIIQNLSVGNELFISKNGKYFVILNNFLPEKSVLKMYNLEEVTRVGSLNGVLVQLQLTDSCQITNLQINQQGNKIVYICVKYLQKTELVIVEHTIGVYDTYNSTSTDQQTIHNTTDNTTNNQEKNNPSRQTISSRYNYMLFIGFCFATFLLFLVVLCLIVLLIKYRRISNRIAEQVQLQFKNAMSRHQKQIDKLKFQNLQINQSKSHNSLFHDVPEFRDSKTTFSRKTVVPCQVTWF